jgi:hypothetical protein
MFEFYECPKRTCPRLRKDCLPGYYYNEELKSCNNCGIGNYCPGGKDRIKCAPGRFNDSDNNYVCPFCHAGTYRNAEMSSCQQCPPGEYSILGSTQCSVTCPPNYYIGDNNNDCLKNDFCPRGSYLNKENNECHSCPVGHYCLGGNEPMKKCPERFYSSDISGETCSICLPGSIINEERTSCTLCEAGTYEKDNKCEKCPEGQRSGEGFTKCTEKCPKDYYADGSNSCIKCVNSYTEEEGAVDKNACICNPYYVKDLTGSCKTKAEIDSSKKRKPRF